MTRNCCNSVRLLMSASEIPSDKYSALGSALVFSNGKTATDLYRDWPPPEVLNTPEGCRHRKSAASAAATNNNADINARLDSGSRFDCLLDRLLGSTGRFRQR